jgi:spermidine synthase
LESNLSEHSLTIPLRGEKIAYSMHPVRHLLRHRSPYQTIDIYDTDAFGKVLMLDGHIQLTSLDEHAYHEALVHLPALSLEDPRTALVIGGGDGGVLRELCRHRGLERIVMVEIDRDVVDVCREHLPELSDGAFDDLRVDLVLGDAFPYVKETSDRFDLIVVDSTDVYESELGLLSERLFTEEFFTDCHRLLKEPGLVVTQADNPVYCFDATQSALDTFGPPYDHVGSFLTLVPSFGGYSASGWAGRGAKLAEAYPADRAASLGLRYLNATTWALAQSNLSFCPIRFGRQR